MGQPLMSAATTLIIAREDFSIPGAAEDTAPTSARATAGPNHFFDLVDRSKPDIIVLDLSRAAGVGTETILTVRQRTDIPILVVCHPDQRLLEDYRAAGAARCISPPIKLTGLNKTIQMIKRAARRHHDSGVGATTARQS